MDLSEFKKIDVDNVKDEFVLYIEELILSGKLKPEERLPPERELALHYNVSRPVIHEGILTLENRGLITLRSRHGVVVNNYKKEATLDLLLTLLASSGHELGPKIHQDMEHFRIQMEKDIILLICNSDPVIGLKELIEINEGMAKAGSPEELSELDFQFHLQLALSCGNTLYALLLNTLKPAHTEYLTQFFQERGIREKVVFLHNKLVSALRVRNADTAVELIVKIDSYETYRD